MSQIESHLEKCLQEWARWYTQQKDKNIAFHHFSNESTLEGSFSFFRAKNSNHQGLPCSNIVDETEKLIVELSHYQTLLADVLRANYIQTGTQQSKAKKLGISLAQFKFCIKLAKAWLCGHYSTILAHTTKLNRKTNSRE